MLNDLEVGQTQMLFFCALSNNLAFTSWFSYVPDKILFVSSFETGGRASIRLDSFRAWESLLATLGRT
jgi:hypothetical protein